jgi:hypothetical protein
MAGEWGLTDMRAKLAALEALLAQAELEDGDGIDIVGDEIRLDIDSLPLAGS